MGTQTMGSQGIGDTSVPKHSGLSRQGSLYSLTFDEVQNHLGNLGKPLGSLNLDELLRTVEATQTVGNDRGIDSGALNVGQSGISLSRDMREKTVEDLWREIQEGRKSSSSGSGSEERNPERQNTLGEMTLEDFLVQAGVEIDARPGANTDTGHLGGGGVDPNVGHTTNVAQQAQWMPYQLIPQQQHNMMTMFMPGGPLSDTGYADAQLAVSPSPILGTMSDPQTVGRKRIAPGSVVEKTVERRQKRMIKNRESAARSRARKQAYTHELENKVSRLEEENERLRKMREVEKALPSVPPPDQPKYQLRRTSSAPM
ncbi:hypothetical protein RND81_12G020800 [Saponaria officinalis]|uniref:BZIP domain-containing protein n=1 Tax=Saponaria officinalis TaxID=3572 RepID=A0AAW1H2F1_SAPOF